MSAKIGLFYGSTTGKTDAVAEIIRDEFGAKLVDLHDIAEAGKEDIESYDYLIIGSPTWNIGELQSDWEAFFPKLDDIDFTGKKVAYFGVGDQVGYPDNFLDAMGILAHKISQQGGTRVGYWPVDGYDFNASKAVKDGQFVGLAIDEDNEPEMTEERITAWVDQIKKAFNL